MRGSSELRSLSSPVVRVNVTAWGVDHLLAKPDRAGPLPAKVGNGAGDGPVVLSAIVRWMPVGSVVNGTLVARMARMIWHAVVPLAAPWLGDSVLSERDRMSLLAGKGEWGSP